MSDFEVHPVGTSARLAELEAIVGAGAAIPLFYAGEGTRCPGCGRSHWHVGRKVAECAFCATALPIAGAKDGK